MITTNVDQALPAIRDLAVQLEERGFEQTVIADALMSAGLSIGNALHGPDRTAGILRQLEQRFTAEAVAAAGGERAEEPQNQLVWESLMAAAITMQHHGCPPAKIAAAMAAFAAGLSRPAGEEAAAAPSWH